MSGGEFFQDRLTTCGQHQINLAMTLRVNQPPGIFFRNQPVRQTHCTVMFDLQPPGQFPNGDPITSGKSLDRQHGLMLLRCHAGGGGRLFAEPQKFSERVA